MSLLRNVLHPTARIAAVSSLLAASALAAQAQVVFSPPNNVSNGLTTGQLSPAMVTSPRGDIYLAWVTSSSIDFSSSSDGGSTFSAPLQVFNGAAAGISMALDSAGNIYIAWEASGSFAGSGGIRVSMSNDRGATFSRPVAVITTHGQNPQLAVDQAGNVSVAWVSITGSTTVQPCPDCSPVITFDWTAFFSQSSDGAVSFSSPTTVFTAQGLLVGKAPFAQIAVPPSGQVYVLAQYPGFLGLARSNDGGATFSMTNLHNSPTYFDAPKMAIDTAGNINVVWAGRHILFSRSTDMGATFSPPANLTPSSLGDNPKIAVDSVGNIYLAWFTTEQSFNPAGTIFFSRSTDEGTTFSSPLALSTDPSGFTNFAGEWGDITVDSPGRIGVTWEDQTPAGDWEIFFSRSSDFGATFTTPTSVSGPGASSSFSLAPVIAGDSRANMFVTWVHTDQWPGPFNVFFSRSAALASATASPAHVTGEVRPREQLP